MTCIQRRRLPMAAVVLTIIQVTFRNSSRYYGENFDLADREAWEGGGGGVLDNDSITTDDMPGLCGSCSRRVNPHNQHVGT